MKNRILQISFFYFLWSSLIMAPVAVPALSAESVFTDPVTAMEFVWVSGGSYQMGQTGAEKEDLIKVMGRDKYEKYCADELPRHRVCVDGFWMGRYEVTNAQYRRFKSDHDSKLYRGHSLNGDNQPVVEVSWEDAVAYAEWLSAKNKRKFRLPTEVEWEYACRAGTTTVRYWGDDAVLACRYANVADRTAKREWSKWRIHDCEDGFKVTAPVGSFQPNSFGLYDMLGNVWEWCSDWFGKNYYKESPELNPQGVGSGSYRIARGSCWDNPPRFVRSASRNRRRPDNLGYALGFRLVASNVAP
ncbi:MAG: formylglycine-generating enzyme family protein [Deltaproteobacteria bacterium]|nr:formylglycine-generating enzyme family protein [Deltaproteobacteria bacterium]